MKKVLIATAMLSVASLAIAAAPKDVMPSVGCPLGVRCQSASADTTQLKFNYKLVAGNKKIAEGAVQTIDFQNTGVAIGEQTPYISKVDVGPDGAKTLTPATLDTGLALGITAPHVEPDGYIVATVKADYSQLQSMATQESGLQLPTVATSKTEQKIKFKSGSPVTLQMGSICKSVDAECEKSGNNTVTLTLTAEKL